MSQILSYESVASIQQQNHTTEDTAFCNAIRMVHCIPYWGVLTLSSISHIPPGLIIIARKNPGQRHLAMKVLEPIHLQTAGFVQACQHLLDLFTCRFWTFLSVQSPTEADGCTFPKHSLASRFHWLIPALIVANTITAERLAFTTGLPSSAEGRREKPGSFA